MPVLKACEPVMYDTPNRSEYRSPIRILGVYKPPTLLYLKFVDCSVIATSSGEVPGYSRFGQWNTTSDAPASRSSLLVTGDVPVAWMIPFGQSRHGASP